jgi:hypothetical protein
MAAATTSRENLSAALTIHLIIGLLMDGERQISSSWCPDAALGVANRGSRQEWAC